MTMTDATRDGHVESMTVHGLICSMSNTVIRPQGKWFVKKYAADNHLTESEAESTLIALIARGHLRIQFGEGARGADAFEFVQPTTVTDNE